MTQEDKGLLLKDLCARLPYGLKLRYVEDLVVKKESHTITLNNVYLEHILNGDADIKPYLRPLSSMTSSEMGFSEQIYKDGGFWEHFDWLNEHHFDYRGLIEKGLALEAPEGMYKND